MQIATKTVYKNNLEQGWQTYNTCARIGTHENFSGMGKKVNVIIII